MVKGQEISSWPPLEQWRRAEEQQPVTRLFLQRFICTKHVVLKLVEQAGVRLGRGSVIGRALRLCTWWRPGARVQGGGADVRPLSSDEPPRLWCEGVGGASSLARGPAEGKSLT